MPLPIGTIVAVNFAGRYQSQRYMLTTTWRIRLNTSTQDTTQDAQSIALFFTETTAGSFIQRYRACLGSGYTITEVSAQAISPTRHVKASVSVVYSGLDAGPIPTGNVAAIITLRTQLAGRSQVANKHIGPLTTNGYNLGIVEGSTFNNLGILGASMTQEKVVTVPGDLSITLTPVIFHKDSGLHDVAVNHVVSDRVGTMRRRTLRQGE